MAKHLHQAAELVGDFLAHADQLGPGCQQSTRPVAVLAFDRHLAIPAGAHDLSQANRVVGIGLVQPHRQRRLGMTRVNADHGQAESVQAAIMPGGHGAGLESDPRHMRRSALNNRGHSFRGGRALAMPRYFAGPVHHAHRRLRLRHVQPDKLFLLHDRLHFPVALR